MLQFQKTIREGSNYRLCVSIAYIFAIQTFAPCAILIEKGSIVLTITTLFINEIHEPECSPLNQQFYTDYL